MNGPSHDYGVQGLQTGSRLAAGIVIGVSCLVLIGWFLELPWLTSFRPGYTSMSIATAICFVVSGLALYAFILAAGNRRLTPWPSRLGAVIVLATGFCALASDALGDSGGGLLLGPSFGQVAPATALNFILFATALLIGDWANGHAYAGLAAVGLIISALDLVGYAYGVEALYRVLPFSAMALPTGLSFALLFVGELMARPQRGWTQYLVRADNGGVVARLLAPAIIVIPFALCFLMVKADDLGVFAPPFGFAIVAVATTVLAGGIVCAVAALLSRADIDRAQADDALRREAAEHRQTAAQLRKSEGLLRLFVEMAPAAIAMFDRDMRYLAASRRFCSDYRLGEQDLIGRSHYELFPEIPERWREIHRRCLAGATERSEEEPFPRADGGTDWVRWEILPWRQDDGTIGGIILLSEVITERKRAELALAETEKKLHQAQKMEAIGNLTGGMAHDFNNLLGVIIGNLDAVRETLAAGSQTDELVNEALDAATHGADLTRRLLAFARIQPLQPRRIDVNGLVSGMARLLGRMLGETISIVLKPASAVWPVVADPAQLESSLLNLCANARDAMPNGGRLMLATDNRRLDGDYAGQHGYAVTPGDYVMVEVSDNGSGMPPEVASRIFEPFFSTKERGKGTGLGLSMVYGFVKQSGGHINVYSEPGIGTTVRLYLPRAADDASLTEARPPAVATGGGETVLVVEDNAAMRRVVMRQLEKLGYRALEAANAAEALTILAGETVDVLFTDVVMPETSGLELARAAVARAPSLKIVLTSGFPEMKIDAGDLRLAGMRLLSKPYRRDDLARVLREALEA